MPALRGSLTYVRYFVEGKAPTDLEERALRAIRLRAMKPLDPDEDVAERSGWCKLGEPMDVDLGFEDVFYNEYVNLGLRTDRWAIPGPLLRTKVREAEQLVLEKKGRERLTRREKAEIKEAVVRKLRRQVTPATRAVDVSWAVTEGVVRFFSHAAKAGAVLEGLFEKTFGLKLVPEAPYTLAARLGMSSAAQAAWDALEPLELEEVG